MIEVGTLFGIADCLRESALRVTGLPHSTFHRYVATGILPANWCGNLVDLPSTVGWGEE